MSGAAITHRTWDRRAVFDERGVSIVPWFGNGLQILWDEIVLVCVTPTMVRDGDGWREMWPHPPGYRSALSVRGELDLSFVVRDRRPVVARAVGTWTRAWVDSSLRGMRDAEDRLQLDRSLLRLTIRCSALDHPLGDLLDLLDAHCRFDLLVVDD